MELLEKKIKLDKNQPKPQMGDTSINGEKLRVIATGVKIKRQPITSEYFFDLDKNYILARDNKHNYVNCKLI